MGNQPQGAAVSQSRLDLVRRIDEFGSDHWRALATKLAKVAGMDPVETVKMLLRGDARFSFDTLCPKDTTHLSLFHTFMLLPGHTVTNRELHRVFSGYLDTDFQASVRSSLNTPPHPNPHKISVYTVDEYADYLSLFTSVCKDIRRLYLTPREITAICKIHRSDLRLHSHETLFLYQGEREPLVARVRYVDGGLSVQVASYEAFPSWLPGLTYHVVVSQST